MKKLLGLTVFFAFYASLEQAHAVPTLTLSLNNFYTWSKGSFWGTYGFENFGNSGIAATGLGETGISGNERLPAPTSLMASLRLTF